MTVWEHRFAATERVVVGPGSLERLGEVCDDLGMERVVVVTGRTLQERTPVVARVERLLGPRHAATFAGMREHVPKSATIGLATLLADSSCSGVVSVGGGSPIDGAKAAIHRRDGGATPHVAVPTTLSAAEFTPTAGVTDDASRVKGGVAGPRLTPRAVVLDAEVTLPTPPRLWLSTGIRALDHAVETVYAPEQDRFAALLALEAVRRLRRWLPRCREDPEDVGARQEAQVAAWLSVLGLPSVTVAPSHPMGRALGATFGVGHGITSCVLLPSAVEAVAARHPDRVALLAPAFDVEDPAAVGPACRAFVAALGLPTRLRDVGLDEDGLRRFAAMLPAEWEGIAQAAY